MMRQWICVLALAASFPLLSGCLTATAALVVAGQSKEARRAREDYRQPAADPFARDGSYLFDGEFGRAVLTVSGGRATVELAECARFFGTLEQGSTAGYDRYVWDLGEPRPEWRRVWGLAPEDVQIDGEACDGLRGSERIQMTTAYQGPDRGGFGSVLFVQALRTPDTSRFFVAKQQTFARAFGAR